MNILIVNHNGGSIYHGPNLRTYYVAKELVMRGHKVTIATSSYSHKYIVAPKIHGLVTAEVIDGIDIGVQALGVCPVKTEKRGAGERDITLTVCEMTICPGDWLYADRNGVLIGPDVSL